MQFDQLKRREVITLIGGAAAAWPLAARAQQPDRVRRIGVLMGYIESDSDAQAWYAAFRDALQRLGWTEGRNTQIESLGKTRRRGVNATLRKGTRRATAQCHSFEHHAHHERVATANAHHTYRFCDCCRPNRQRFRASFVRPGGNVTGFIFTEPTMAGKWLELLKGIAPRIARVAMLFNPVSAPYAEYWLNPLKAAAILPAAAATLGMS